MLALWSFLYFYWFSGFTICKVWSVVLIKENITDAELLQPAQHSDKSLQTSHLNFNLFPLVGATEHFPTTANEQPTNQHTHEPMLWKNTKISNHLTAHSNYAYKHILTHFEMPMKSLYINSLYIIFDITLAIQYLFQHILYCHALLHYLYLCGYNNPLYSFHSDPCTVHNVWLLSIVVVYIYFHTCA